MKQVDRGEPPAFLSTHPSHSQRIERMREWLPEARKEYDLGDCQTVVNRFNRAAARVPVQNMRRLPGTDPRAWP